MPFHLFRTKDLDVLQMLNRIGGYHITVLDYPEGFLLPADVVSWYYGRVLLHHVRDETVEIHQDVDQAPYNLLNAAAVLSVAANLLLGCPFPPSGGLDAAYI